MTDRERDLSAQDRDELGALRDADEIRAARRNEAERIERETRARAAKIGAAIETARRDRDGNTSPLFPSAQNLQLLEEARARFSTLTLIEQRAAIATTDMGTAREYGPNGLQAPRTLWRSAGIPTTAPDGYSGVVPQFSLPAGVPWSPKV